MLAALGAYLGAALVCAEVVTSTAIREVAVSIGAMALGVLAFGVAVRFLVRGIRINTLVGVCVHVALLCAVVMVVAWVAGAHAAHRWDGGFMQAMTEGSAPVQLDATAAREPIPLAAPGFDGEQRYRLELRVSQWRLVGSATSSGDGGEWSPSFATVVVVSDADLATVMYGDAVLVTTHLTVTHGSREVAIGWNATLDARTPATGHNHLIASIREDFRRSTAGLPKEVRGLTRGMVIGDTRAMPPEQREVMQVTGLTHLTAVSGAHFAVVAVVLHGALRRVRLNRGPPTAARALRALVAGTGMVCFAALVFPDPSVVRAFAMASLGALAVWWGRPAQALPALSCSVIVLLLVDPYLALEAGFALSVAAVGAIVLWAPRLRGIFERRMPPTLAMLLSVPLAAQAACAPLLILLEPRVSMYAVLANLVAGPFAAPVTVMGLGAVLLGSALGDVAGIGAWGVSLAVWPVAWTARAVAALPGATIAWPPGAAGACLLAALTATAIWWTVPRGAKAVKASVSAVLIIALVGTAHQQATWDWVNRPPGDWAIVACDVGQGDMMLIRTAAHSAVVIDTGPGDGSAAACLTRFGVTQVPLLILTHPHADHDGGVAELASQAEVATAWIPPLALAPGLDGAATILRDLGADVALVRDGAVWQDHAVSIVLRHGGALASSPEGAAPRAGESYEGKDLNDASLVVSGVAQGVSFLALGDIEERAQRDLERQLVNALQVDVVKVPHHGSRTQEEVLVDKIVPQVAIVSSGVGNTYGHPSARAIDLYAQAGARVVRTDECGDVALWRDSQLMVASECG